jgi:hypothetical protein
MAELAEGTRLLSEYGGKPPSRVRIPVSPPHVIIPGILSRVFYFKPLKNFVFVDKTILSQV